MLYLVARRLTKNPKKISMVMNSVIFQTSSSKNCARCVASSMKRTRSLKIPMDIGLVTSAGTIINTIMNVNMN